MDKGNIKSSFEYTEGTLSGTVDFHNYGLERFSPIARALLRPGSGERGNAPAEVQGRLDGNIKFRFYEGKQNVSSNLIIKRLVRNDAN